MFKSRGLLRLLLLALPLLLGAESAFAWVGVGPDASCEVRTIQAAIDRIISRQVHGDFADPQIVVASGTFNEALQINARGISGARAILTLTGGYDSGCHAPQSGGTTTINAVNRSRSVVAVDGNIRLTLSSLQLTGASTTGNGGGIGFGGDGTLDLTDVSIFGNHAGYGGGLFASGLSALAVTLHSPGIIRNNSADHAGGGVRIQGQTQLLTEVGTSIFENIVNSDDADGAGGGLQIISPASAHVQSGYIFGNNARYGAGLSVHGTLASALFETEPGNIPTEIKGNTATEAGGGLFVSKGTVLCGQCQINDNQAQEGAATYIDVGGGSLTIDSGSVNENVATNGSVMLTQTNAFFGIYKTEVRDNIGTHIYHGFATGDGAAKFADVLIAENRATDNFFVMDEKGAADIRRVTVASNVIDGPGIFSVPGNFTLRDSIIWQLMKTTLIGHIPGDTSGLNIGNVITAETTSLSGWPGILNQNPQLTSPNASGNGGYRLTISSPAVDYAPAEPGVDLDGFPRTVDQASVPNRNGPMDLGAYELQSTLPPETFDEVSVPALPSGWTTTHTSNNVGWITVQGNAFSQPNIAFTDDFNLSSDKSLQTPSFFAKANSQVSFHQRVSLESGVAPVALDAGVLEISIAGGAFTDILAAGGTFVSGGYDHTVSGCCFSALAGRAAWSGSGGFQTVVANLPAVAYGKYVMLRWRVVTDFSGAVFGGGYWLDDIRVTPN